MSDEVNYEKSAAAAAAAERLLNDPYLKETLDEMVEENMKLMVYAATEEARRDGRHMILAVNGLRARLENVFKHWQAAHLMLVRARAHE